MPGAAGTTFNVCAEETPAGAAMVKSMPIDDSSEGTSTLIWPPVPDKANIGAGEPPNRTLTPFTLVDGNEYRLSCVPNPVPKSVMIDPGAAAAEARKLAALTTALMTGAAVGAAA